MVEWERQRLEFLALVGQVEPKQEKPVTKKEEE